MIVEIKDRREIDRQLEEMLKEDVLWRMDKTSFKHPSTNDCTTYTGSSQAEIDRPDLMRFEMIVMMDDVRHRFGGRVIITDSHRTMKDQIRMYQKFYEEHGFVPDSAHMVDPGDGLYSGIDFTTGPKAITSSDVWKLNSILREVGFKRIGFYKDMKHIHVDIEERLPQGVMWIS